MGRWSSSPLARPSRHTHFHQSSSQCSVYNLRLALLLFDASGCAAMVARAATSAPSSAKGQNARSAATTELAFMRNRSPPAADRFRLLLNVEKHVLPSSSLTACSLGLTRGASCSSCGKACVAQLQPYCLRCGFDSRHISS